jgi:uncharacterized protein
MAKKFIQRFIPNQEKLAQNKALRWLGPTLFHPNLWHINRESIARGMALGMFMGFLIPIGQIFVAAVFAVFFRANLPTAAVATLVTNPFTFAPVYFFAYQLGSLILGSAPAPEVAPEMLNLDPELLVLPPQEIKSGISGWLVQLEGLGAPLFLGLLILAVSGASVSYFGVKALWRLQVVRRLEKKRRRLPRG